MVKTTFSFGSRGDQRSCPVKVDISLKVICEKSHFQTVIFAMISMTINEHIDILFKSIHNDVHTKGKGEINTAYHNFSKHYIF